MALKISLSKTKLTSLDLDSTHVSDPYNIHNHCRIKMSHFVGSTAGGPYVYGQVHPTPSTPFLYDFLSYRLSLGLQNCCLRFWTSIFLCY